MSIAMGSAATTDVLNRLLRTLCRSLPMYLKDAKSWHDEKHREAWQAITDLAADQEHYAERVATIIYDEGDTPDPGGFPVEFASCNDLAAEFLLGTVIASHRCDLDRIARCVDELHDLPALREVAEEILGNARGHLEMLEKLLSSP